MPTLARVLSVVTLMICGLSLLVFASKQWPATGMQVACRQLNCQLLSVAPALSTALS